MKKKEGISLISLVITIVVIIILVGMSIYNGISKNLDETGNTMNYNEIFEVSEAVSQRSLFNRLNPKTYELIGKSGEFTITMEQASGDETVEVEKTYKTDDGWYKIDNDNYERLNLEKVRRNYVVNYETGEVVSFQPIIYEGKKYYRASELRDAISGGDATVSPSRYDESKGVNKPYVTSGMVPVKMVGGNWVITNVDDNSWYDYASTEDGKGNLWANVMLADEIEVEGMTNDQVRKSTINQLEGKKVTTEGSMYVWIPRYSRGVVNGETQIVYSRLTEDYFKENTPENVLDAFEDDGVKLTGIWVSKYNAGYIEK